MNMNVQGVGGAAHLLTVNQYLEFPLVAGVAGPCLHAQARLLPPGHEAREPALHGTRPRQDRRLWSCS